MGCAPAGKGCSHEVPGVGGVYDPLDGRGMSVPHIKMGRFACDILWRLGRGEQSQNSVHTYNISGRHSPAREVRRSDRLYMAKTMRCKGEGST